MGCESVIFGLATIRPTLRAVLSARAAALRSPPQSSRYQLIMAVPSSGVRSHDRGRVRPVRLTGLATRSASRPNDSSGTSGLCKKQYDCANATGQPNQ